MVNDNSWLKIYGISLRKERIDRKRKKRIISLLYEIFIKPLYFQLCIPVKYDQTEMMRRCAKYVDANIRLMLIKEREKNNMNYAIPSYIISSYAFSNFEYFIF